LLGVYMGLLALAACSGSSGVEGPTGPQGDRGVQGPLGAQGPQGPQGVQGVQGPVGSTGPAGPAGIDGVPGPMGPPGPIGPLGPLGPQGPLGFTGPKGDPGPTGATGLTGPTGPTGAVGPRGAAGDQGPVGPPGQLFAPPEFADAGMLLVAGSVTTAPSDGARLMTGFSRGCGGSCGVAEGPFVLTDARNLDFFDIARAWFYTVPAATDCTVTCDATLARNVDADPLIVLSTPFPSSPQVIPTAMTGGRYFIPAGRRLCVCADGFGAQVRVSWAGFVPYQ
jgi:hypothetical protein